MHMQCFMLVTSLKVVQRWENCHFLKVIMADIQEDDFRSCLIEEVQNYPGIYDKANPNHFCTTFTNQKFDEICANLGVNGEFYFILVIFQ